MRNEFWILRPFNGIYLCVAAFFFLLLTCGSLVLRKKSEDTRRKTLVVVCLLTLIGYFIYKHCLSLDPEYDVAYASMGGFTWWGELPLHLCNINMILIPTAVLTKKRPLMSFCFFVGSLGALLGLLMPGLGFSGYPIWLPRMIGYFGTHFMILIESLSLVTLGLYRPEFKDLPKTVLTLFCISVVIFLIDLLLRTTGLNPRANYFFLMETEGNGLLELLYRFIPVPFLYLAPGLLIISAYIALVTGGFVFFERRKTRGDGI